MSRFFFAFSFVSPFFFFSSRNRTQVLRRGPKGGHGRVPRVRQPQLPRGNLALLLLMLTPLVKSTPPAERQILFAIRLFIRVPYQACTHVFNVKNMYHWYMYILCLCSYEEKNWKKHENLTNTRIHTYTHTLKYIRWPKLTQYVAEHAPGHRRGGVCWGHRGGGGLLHRGHLGRLEVRLRLVFFPLLPFGTPRQRLNATTTVGGRYQLIGLGAGRSGVSVEQYVRRGR